LELSEGYSQAPTAGLPGRVAIQGTGNPHDAQDSHPHHPKLQHHFDDMAQQAEASTLGMWVFLVTEIMFFGGLFMAYLLYRWQSPTGFAEASNHLNVIWGAANTVVLIVSSLTMALAVRAAQLGKGRQTALLLVATMALAAVFLCVKSVEYSSKWEDGLVPGLHWAPPPGSDRYLNLFYALYFVMTGCHALHMLVGLGLMAVVGVRAWRGRYSPANHTGVECLGLYWHFVDLVWIFLFPLLYLLHGHGGHHG
jgi:cytochrome c oxidase subunit 3